MYLGNLQHITLIRNFRNLKRKINSRCLQCDVLMIKSETESNLFSNTERLQDKFPFTLWQWYGDFISETNKKIHTCIP